MKYKTHKQYHLPDFNYFGEGEYFVTICTHKHKHYFGKIMSGEMILNRTGKIAENLWNEIPLRFNNFSADVYQIMPNHMHGIIKIDEENFINEIPTFKSGIKNNPMELKSNSLGGIMRWFKGRVTFDVRKLNPGFKWQSRFHERVIRDEKEFYFIQEYIINNPLNWGKGILNNYFKQKPK
jgi:REP element-mobilizing transposase RayT